MLCAWYRFASQTDYQAAALARGIDPAFLGLEKPAKTQIDQPVTALAAWQRRSLLGCVPCFENTTEMGLWIAQDQRGRGLGRLIFACALARQRLRHTRALAFVPREGRSCGPMTHILQSQGFTKWAVKCELELWGCDFRFATTAR